MGDNRIRDWAAETAESISARLEGAKASQMQARRTIGVMAIISVMMLIASYNAYFSYDYWYMTANLRRVLDDNTVSDALMNQAARDWAMSRTISSTFLGIRVSVDDVAVLGTAALAILSLWLVLAKRRENHTIGFLLRNTDSVKPQTGSQSSESLNYERWQIFHAIAANAQFETADASLACIDSLEGSNPLEVEEKRWRRWLNDHVFGLIRCFFFGFPILASLIVFGIDRWSYFMADPFEPAGRIPGAGDPFYRLSMYLYFAFLIPLALCCWKANQYAGATEKVIRQYLNKLLQDLKRGRAD